MKWARENLFSSWPSTLATLFIVLLAWKVVPPFFQWAITHAVWSAPGPEACRAVEGRGACWAFIAEKHRFILFGTYPFDQHWRPAAATVLLLSSWGFSLMRTHWRPWLALPQLVCGRLPGRNRCAGTMASPQELIMSLGSA